MGSRRFARTSLAPGPRARPTKTRRLQVLMEPDEYALLERIAEQRGTSVSDLIREAARAQLFGEASRARRREAARAFLALREAKLPSWKELERELEARRG